MKDFITAAISSTVSRSRKAIPLWTAALAVASVFGFQTAYAQEVIKFGAPLPITGPLAPEALKQKQGYDLWANQVNLA